MLSIMNENMNEIINNLPTEFYNRMKNRLKEQASSFFDSFNDEPQKGIHVNTKRINNDDFKNMAINLNFENIPYYSNGYYDNSGIKTGHNPLSHAGIIYSQDPAAMMPVAALSDYIKPDSKVLDLCSAPGGKASQAAMLLDDEKGFLVANEINPSRNKILCSNIERMGYKNVLITKAEPDFIAKSYNSYFDVVIVDAPCSGEGMFRKYPESIQEWSVENVKLCALRQKEILTSAFECLKPEGILLYSTCTYSSDEDDEIVKWLTDEFNMSLIMPAKYISDYSTALNFEEARIFYPHMAKGEGQFLCILKKPGCSNNLSSNLSSNIINLGNIKPLNNKEIHLILNETEKYVTLNKNKLYKFNDSILYIENPNVMLCSKCITKAFIQIGSIVKNRFVPEHGLFHCLGDYFTNFINLDMDDPRLLKYLHGEEIDDNQINNGYGVIKVFGAPIGGFKASNGKLKNHYPKGLRNNN